MILRVHGSPRPRTYARGKRHCLVYASTCASSSLARPLCSRGRSRTCLFFPLSFVQEMGLGKTVEMLGCILANPCPTPTDQAARIPSSSTSSGSSTISGAAARGSDASSRAAGVPGSGEGEEDEGDDSSAVEAPTGKSSESGDMGAPKWPPSAQKLRQTLLLETKNSYLKARDYPLKLRSGRPP